MRNDLALQTAEDVAATLGTMKGVLMKLRQMASYVHDGLSPAARRTLGRLQGSVPPMSPELAARVVTKELGLLPERAFATWDPELRDRIAEELDYRTEARNQQMFARYYDGHPTIHVPEVFPEPSTRRVFNSFTGGLAVGARFARWLAAGRAGVSQAAYSGLTVAASLLKSPDLHGASPVMSVKYASRF